MILFLYGPDTYRSRQKLNEIIEHYKKVHKSGLNLKYFDDENLNFQDFKDEVRQTSMFAEKKLIILAEAFPNSEFKEKFLKGAKIFRDAEDVILFYETGQIPEKDSLFDFLIKQAKCQEFKPLEGQRLRNWIKKEFEKYQTGIENKALDKLIEFVGSNLWQMSNEIRKLVSYRAPRAARRRDKSLLNLRSAPPRSVAEGGKENEVLFDHKSKYKNIEISSGDIELLVKPKIETDIFKTIDALALKDKKQALGLVHKHLEKGDSPLYLLSMINFQFRNLLIVKDLIQKYRSPYIPSKVTNLHPYIIKKSYSLAQKFTIQELKKIYQKIFQVDLDIKTGRVEPEVALDLLIAEI